jgi:hypothetical protein
LEKEYQDATNKLDRKYKEIVSKYNEILFKNQGNGAAILLTERMEIIYSNIGLDNYDNIKDERTVWCASSQYHNDTLEISINDIFGNQFINIYVSNDSIDVTFEEYYKSDFIIRMNEFDTTTNQLKIPLETADVLLSKTSDFICGEVIFGKLILVTEPFYLGSSNFKCLKREYECYFKFKVRSEHFFDEYFNQN